MPEKAINRILSAQEQKSTKLDLSQCDLKELPIELNQMTWLEDLRLDGNNELKDITLLKTLSKLQFLDISYTQTESLESIQALVRLETLKLDDTRIFDLGPLRSATFLKELSLSNTPVRDISHFGYLSNLSKLNLSYTPIKDIDTLFLLKNLKELNLSNSLIGDLNPLHALISLEILDASNSLVSDLIPLTNLINLKKLNVHNSYIRDLWPLSNLQHLNNLKISITLVRDLEPLVHLPNLLELDIFNTNVNDLSPVKHLISNGIEVKWEESNYTPGIYVKNCQITNPPKEILDQGQPAIIRYFEEEERLKKANKPVSIKVREAKVLLVGQGKSGKTTLRRKLGDPEAEMPAPGDSTRGIEITYLYEKMPHSGEDFRLNIWDFGGQDIQHYAHQFFLTGSSLYALVTNERIQDTVHLPYWLNIIELLGKKSPVILIQNKDGGNCQPLKDEAAIRARFSNVYNKVYQSDFSQAKGEKEFNDLRKKIIELASELPHIEREYLSSFNQLRNKLELEAQSERHYLRWTEYLQFMPELNEDLLRDYAIALTFLGVCQYFPDDLMLSDYVFLRPKWLIDALFELLLHPSLDDTRGYFSERDTRKIWARGEYFGMHSLLIRMMKEFELCYRVEGEEERYIIPQRLPSENKSYGWDSQNNIPIQYRYKFMPKGILTRLICRLHPRIENDISQGQRVWNDAVIFTLPDGKGRVFVREIYNENTIELRASGEKSAEMLNEVIRKMDDINKDARYEDLQVEKMVPCPCLECSSGDNPGFHDYDALIKRIEKGKTTSECKKSGEDIPIDDIFGKSGVRNPNLPDVSKIDDTENSWLFPNQYNFQPLKVFISYSKNDQVYKDELLKHLASLRHKKILSWHDQDIIPGEDWDKSIHTALNEAKVMLYLVTANSLSADYIQRVELPFFFNQKDRIIIPIIVGYCNWKDHNFSQLNVLPNGGIEIVNKKHWNNEDEAWLNVIEGIKRVLKVIK